MVPAPAGAAALQRWRLGRALAAAVALAAAAPGAAVLRSRGQDLPGISDSLADRAPDAEPEDLDIRGLQDISDRSSEWEAREWEASRLHSHVPDGAVGLRPTGRSSAPGAAAEAAASAPPRPQPETSYLMKRRSASASYRGEPARLSSPQVASTSYRQAMTNYGDVQYISQISVGRQQLSGILDTGSFELVVFSKKCSSCGKAAKYNPEDSSAYLKGILTSGQAYGSGSCNSNDAFDHVSIGQFESSNQSFWEVTEAYMPILVNAAFQSIIGLGPPETPNSDAWNSAASAVENVTAVLAKGQLPPSELANMALTKTIIAVNMVDRPTVLDTFHSPSFSVCIGKKPGSEGFFTWNDTAHLRNPQSFVRVQIVGKHTWSVRMSNARLSFKSQGFLESQLESPKNGDHQTWDHQTWWVKYKPLRKVKTSSKTFNTSRNTVMLGCEDNCSALVDSGTSLLSVPTAIVDKLMIAVKKLHTNCSNIGDLPNLEFELDGKLFSLPPDSYIVEVGSAGSTVPSYLANFVRIRTLESDSLSRSHCELAVFETFSTGQFGPLWILGLPFFRNFYTTFSVGETKPDRALFIAHAGPDCFPVEDEVARKQPLQLYRRRVDLSKIWMPQTAAKASMLDEVLL